MKKLFYLIYSIIVGSIFLTAITFLSVKVYQEYSHGDLRSQVRFDKLCNNIKILSSKNSSINNNFIKQLENAVGDKNDFASLVILVNGKNCFSINSTNQVTESNLIKNLSRSFTSGNNSISISGNMYIVRPGIIYYYGKITFITILIFTIITIILIIYVNLHTSDKKSSIQFDNEEQKAIPLSTINTSTLSNFNTKTVDNIIIKENIIEENNSENTTEEAIELNSNVAEESSDTEEKISIAEVTPVELPSKDITPMDIETETEPAGLFSPTTGIGWESYLLTRLENELNRATASEIDFSLFIIKIPGVERSNPVIKEICDYLCVEFQFKDLLFEYKDDCIVAMKISINVDEAIVFADKLYVEINSKLKDLNTKCYIGISTRTIRMLSAERFLKEAEEALKHAEDENEGIIAFRADADKYRKFLENNA